MSQKYLDNYVAMGLILAIVVAVVALLSSCTAAEAARVRYKKHHTVHLSRSIHHVGHALGRVSGPAWNEDQTTFERSHASVEYVLEWPHLPSVHEVLVKVAKVRLAEFHAEVVEAKEEERKALELKLDWEAGKKALALAFISIGFVLTICVGCIGHPQWRKDQEQSSFDLRQ